MLRYIVTVFVLMTINVGRMLSERYSIPPQCLGSSIWVIERERQAAIARARCLVPLVGELSCSDICKKISYSYIWIEYGSLFHLEKWITGHPKQR